MKSFAKKSLAALIAAAVVAGLIFAYLARREEAQGEEEDQPVKAASRVAMVDGQNVVTLDAAARATGGIVVGALPAAEYQPQARAYGNVIDTGELTDLRNALATAAAQLAKAQAGAEVARMAYTRARALFDANQNIAGKDVQAAAGALQTDEADVRAAQASLDAARATAEQRWGSSIAGWLENGGDIFGRLRRQENLLVEVTLAPSQVGISAPERATLELADGGLTAATLVSPAIRADPKLQGRGFFYLVAPENKNLLPGMNTVALLPTGKPAASVRVPRSAVVWLQGKPWAYAQVQPDKFARREISTDAPTPDGWVQPPAFERAEPFVLSGPQVLLSEEFRAQISIED